MSDDTTKAAEESMSKHSTTFLKLCVSELEDAIQTLETGNIHLVDDLVKARERIVELEGILACGSAQQDIYENRIAELTEALEKIAADFGTDHCDGNTMIAYEVLRSNK